MILSRFWTWLTALRQKSGAAPAGRPRDGTQPATGEPVIHIHEDEWGIRSLYPLVARAEVRADIDEAVAAGVRNRDPQGYGWQDIHMIDPPAATYADSGLLLSAAAAALSPIMPRVRHFRATVLDAIGSGTRDPYGSYEDDAWCFGLGDHCYIKLEVEGQFVRSIWYDLSSTDPEDADRLRNAMEAIDAMVPSLLADYHLNTMVPIANGSLLSEYFARLQGQG